MSFLVRRLRAIVIVALLWAVPWSLIGLSLNVVLLLAIGLPLQVFISYLPLQLLFHAVCGALSGASFAILMILAERGKTLEHLSRGRMMLWGGVGGSFLSLLGVVGISFVLGQPSFTQAVIVSLLGLTVINGVLGATFASTHLKLARQVGPGIKEVPSLAEGTG